MNKSVAIQIADTTKFEDIVVSFIKGQNCQGDFECQAPVVMAALDGGRGLEFYCKKHGDYGYQSDPDDDDV